MLDVTWTIEEGRREVGSSVLGLICVFDILQILALRGDEEWDRSIDSMYSSRRSGVCEVLLVTPKPSLLLVSQRQGRRKVRKAAGREANLLCGKSVICGFCLVGKL